MDRTDLTATLADGARSAIDTAIAALGLWVGGGALVYGVMTALRRLGLGWLTTGVSGRVVFSVAFLSAGVLTFAGFVARERIRLSDWG